MGSSHESFAQGVPQSEIGQSRAIGTYVADASVADAGVRVVAVDVCAVATGAVVAEDWLKNNKTYNNHDACAMFDVE